jgi:iron complex outermembrane receptor protein
MHGMAGSYSMERRSLNLHFMTCSKTALASSIALITSVVYANEAEVSQLPTITVNATQIMMRYTHQRKLIYLVFKLAI